MNEFEEEQWLRENLLPEEDLGTMGIFQWVKDTIDGVVAASQGVDAGEIWIEQGGSPPTLEEFHRFYAGQGIESPDWRAFNRGFRSVVGYPPEDEEDE